MNLLHCLATLHLIAAAAAASLPGSSDASDTLHVLLNRHASGCSHSATWQGGAESNSAQTCTNGTSLTIVNKDPAINKTDCQALVQQLSGKAGTGHWDIQWNCDGTAPDVLGSQQACGFSIDRVTESSANTWVSHVRVFVMDRNSR